MGSKISSEDKLILSGYLLIAVAYTVLFVVKVKHLKKA